MGTSIQNVEMCNVFVQCECVNVYMCNKDTNLNLTVQTGNDFEISFFSNFPF